MAIEKNFNKIYLVKDFTEMLNLNPMKSYQVDSILGIIDLNGNNKYLLVVSSTQFIANILGVAIYNILDVDLIKITLFNENENEKNRMAGVKKLFQTKNFYFSNEVDLSNNNIFSKNKKNIISDYCVNSSLLKYFFDNLITNDFYSKIIYGYIGYNRNVEIKGNNNNAILVDNLIIERVNKHLSFSTDIPNQMKEIEFINFFKINNYNNDNNNNNNKNIRNFFSFIIYVSNEISNTKIAFNPWNNFIKHELSFFSNIVCIINNNINVDLENNININNNQIGNIIFNSNSLGQKVKLLNFTTDWKKNLFFDSNNNSNIYIKSGVINSNIKQEYVFWFIDINNKFFENDCCFNAIIRIMWKAIQQQINVMNLGIDIGLFNKNNNGLICNKFKDLIMKYHKDLDDYKKTMYKSPIRKQLQKVFDYYFNYTNNNNKNINIYDNNFKQNNKNNSNKKNSNNNIAFSNKNNNNINLEDSNNFNKNNLNAYQQIDNYPNNNNIQNQKKQFKNNNNINSPNNNINNINNNNINNNINKKLKILCITWNVAGIPSDNKYNIADLFKKNIFYQNNQSPDIIIIGMQEIVELDIFNILTITTNEDSVENWTENIISTLNDIYPYTYKKSSILHLIGIYCICFIKSQYKDKIDIFNTNIIKTGLFGNLGNKGYITLSIKYDKKYIISFAVCHLEAGQNSIDERIDTLKQILDTKINNYSEQKFKNSDYWIVLGDLNFRIDTSFETAFEMIKSKQYNNLIKYDQFYRYGKRDREMAIFTEGTINFAPTYKYVPGSNNYINDSEKLRIPSYTDRILFCDKRGIKNICYKSIQSLMYSDHRPVHAEFEIDIIKNNYAQNNHININNNMNMNNNNNYNQGNNPYNNFDDYYNSNNFLNNNNNPDFYNNNNNQNNFYNNNYHRKNQNYNNFNNNNQKNINQNTINRSNTQTNYNNYNNNMNNYNTCINYTYGNRNNDFNNRNNNNISQNMNKYNNNKQNNNETNIRNNNLLKQNKNINISSSTNFSSPSNKSFPNNNINNSNKKDNLKLSISDKKLKEDNNNLKFSTSDKKLKEDNNNLNKNFNINNNINNNIDSNFDESNNKTYVFFEKDEESKNKIFENDKDDGNNKDDNDNIENLMKFFK